MSQAELKELAGKAGGVSDIFSWKSPTARSMNLQAGKLSEPEMLKLMEDNPQLIRRPIIIKDGQLQIGFTKEGLRV